MDSFVLYGPGGASPLQIGSWVQVDPGVDFGAAGLLRAEVVDQPFTEGVLAFEDVGPRHMAFPLMVGSGPWGSLTQAESLLRQLSRPGGYIDVQPEGVPSTEAVRFDILAGRWEPHYRAPLQRVSRREGSLLLDAKPYGYWPTWITLASVASSALPAMLTVPQASFIGDAPGLLELSVSPTSVPSNLVGSGPFLMDALLWGIGGGPSFVPNLNGGSWGSATNGAGAPGDARALGSVAMANYVLPAASGWRDQFHYTIASALAPAYSGRFRAFALLLTGGGAAQAMLDVSSIDATTMPLASGGQIATVAGTTIGYQFLDFGEIQIGGPSAAQQKTYLRLWSTLASQSATYTFYNGGVYLQPVGGEGGILSRGLVRASIGAAANQQTGFRIDPYNGPVRSVGSEYDSARTNYLGGGQPKIGASTIELHVLALQRPAAATAAGPYRTGDSYAAIGLRFQPRFQFLKGI